MISAGIKDVKNNLSRLLTRVKAGEDVMITDRGKPIARIIKEEQGEKSIREYLNPLVQRGLIILPSRSVLKEHIKPIKVEGRSVSEMVIEDRR